MGHRLQSHLFGVLLVVLAAANLAHAQGIRDVLLGKSKPIPADRRFEVMVPARDGTKLATLVTLPAGSGPWPVIFTRTPYGKESPGLGPAAVEFHNIGYVHVVQDTRGMGKSEGTFGTFEHEKPDGFDSILWITQQPWCNGKVGMFGISAGGILANLAAMAQPPALVCSFVVVAHGCDYRYGTYSGGVFQKDLNERWYKLLRRPLEPSLLPRVSPYDQKAADMDMRQHFTKVNIPTFNVCGWYDCFVQSGIENFAGLHNQGAGQAKGNQRLVVGAFGHFPLNGKLEYPKEASKPDTAAVQRWFDHWLKGIDTGIMAEEPVKYFLMGDPFDPSAPGNEWRTAKNWPPLHVSQTLWLAEKGDLRSAPSDSSSTLEYTSDPKNPVPTIGGNNLFLSRGPMNQAPTRNRKDVLRFVGQPLDAPTEIAGPVHVDLLVSTDGPDTDFIVKLVDIYPDGYEALVLDQAMRLRYRDGFDAPKPAEPNQPYALSFDLGNTALVFNKGHRIAVHVQSTNYPRFEPHSNTWDPVENIEQARVATNRLLLGTPKGSRLILPVIQATGTASKSP
jgi:predicted acyl esterase